jgi:hypothetical protein
VAIAKRQKENPGCTLIFPNQAGNPDQHLLRVVQRIAGRAGGAFHADLHTYRRTYATRFSGTTKIQTIRCLLGHKDIKTTMRYLGIPDLNSPETPGMPDQSHAAPDQGGYAKHENDGDDEMNQRVRTLLLPSFAGKSMKMVLRARPVEFFRLASEYLRANKLCRMMSVTKQRFCSEKSASARLGIEQHCELIRDAADPGFHVEALAAIDALSNDEEPGINCGIHARDRNARLSMGWPCRR